MSTVIYGFHGVTAILVKNPGLIQAIYIEQNRRDKRMHEVVAQAQSAGVSVEFSQAVQLAKLADNQRHQGIVALLKVQDVINPCLSLKEFLAQQSSELISTVMVLDGVTDPHNLGAIIRSCDCFGVGAVILPKDNSASVNATVARVSSGAVNNLSIIVVNNIVRALDDLKDAGYWTAGTTLAPTSVSLFDFEPDNKIVWVMGNEGDGIRRLVRENCDYLVSIPMLGQTQSLNVSVAAGVVLAHTNYKRLQPH